jgi:hypothetical protein
MAAAGNCRLKVIRRTQYVDLIRSYRIRVNGRDVATIGRNAVVEVDVPGGPLTIEGCIDWCGSAPLVVEGRPGETIEVEVSNPWSAWLALWAVTFGRRRYLVLERVS